MTIENVVFDFGGVLVRWNQVEVASTFYAEQPLRDSLLREVLRHPDWLELDRGTLSDEDAVERFAARMHRPVSEMVRFLQHVRDFLTPIHETGALLRRLEASGIALYGLSNMAASTFAHLRTRYDFWSAFRGIVISGEIKMIKPEPRIFDHLCREYDLTPSRTLFIDDHVANTDSARALGFRTILFKDPQQCAEDVHAILPANRR